MKQVALIVAGGNGSRMRTNTPKQFLLIKGRPVLMHTIEKFSDFDEIILVLPEKEVTNWKNLCEKYCFEAPHKIVFGGEERHISVNEGLKNINEDSIVAIHDGVRPLISKNLIRNLIQKVKPGHAAIPVLPIKDSVRKISDITNKNLKRQELFLVQTPQCFMSSDIKSAYKKFHESYFTDDASIFEKNSGNVLCINGEEKNIKITTKDDLLIADLFMQ